MLFYYIIYNFTFFVITHKLYTSDINVLVITPKQRKQPIFSSFLGNLCFNENFLIKYCLLYVGGGDLHQNKNLTRDLAE